MFSILSNCLYIKLGEQKRYTYKTFKEEVDNIAASLLDLGFQKHDRLAVWLPNTSENVTISYVASKLGLIKVIETFSFSF
ncbi:MAG: AMP-binding protein [Ignavibacteria bacterium]|nr:AMP-binding protein [Ignavibacteria bacterium]